VCTNAKQDLFTRSAPTAYLLNYPNRLTPFAAQHSPFQKLATMTTTSALAELSALENSRDLDLEEARSIQDLMLPGNALCLGPVTISHEFQPVTEVGGDFLDYFALADGTIGLYLGDVCGKGLPAALYAALAVGTLRGVHKTGQSPSNVLGMLNRRLTIRGIPRRYTAIQYAVFDPISSVMRVASAGMSGPFHVSAKGCRALQLSGLPPGLFADATYDTFDLQLAPGDSVLFCTDGILDALNSHGESFGIERLTHLCASPGQLSARELLGQIFAAVEDFAQGQPQHDDMAATVFHCAES
jgi:phosphoserine phosphatase RsbU/P